MVQMRSGQEAALSELLLSVVAAMQVQVRQQIHSQQAAQPSQIRAAEKVAAIAASTDSLSVLTLPAR